MKWKYYNIFKLLDLTVEIMIGKIESLNIKFASDKMTKKCQHVQIMLSNNDKNKSSTKELI